VTTESNPESTSPEFFAGLVDAGFTRVSLGMQSAAPHVLRVLDRRHTPGRAVAAAAEARAAGLAHVNLDLIYATPGETDADLAASLDAVLDAGVDHVSAYALIVEDGTGAGPPGRPRRAPAPGRRRGRRPLRDDRRPAHRGRMSWYEVSNWASGPEPPASTTSATGSTATGGAWARARTPHLAGSRWWNVKHPARYAAALAAGESPQAGREELTEDERHTERVMLRLRLAQGLPLDLLDAPGRAALDRAAADGLLELRDGRAVLTRRGRLLADAVVHALLAGAPA
jgi:oxygen-independent coproporphyrinogen-3 oxidase